MVKKADIVQLTDSKIQKIRIVDKVVKSSGEEVAIVRWFHSNGARTFLPPSRLITLRTSEEAGQRGRKKLVPGLQESTGIETKIIKLDEDY